MMKRIIIVLMAVLAILVFASTSLAQEFLISVAVEEHPIIGLPNPASVYCCVTHDYTCEIRNHADGGQYGMCIFPDDNECEEWSFYLGKCGRKYAAEKPLKVTGINSAIWSLRSLISNSAHQDNEGIVNAHEQLMNK